MAINYGLDRVRFLAPVRVGSEVRARASISDIQEKSPGAWLVRYEVEIEIRGEDKPALKATWLVMQVTGPDA
jgi:acyl dehydratase